MEVANLNKRLRDKYEIPPDEEGVVVIEVEPGSTSSSIGLMEGDLIKSVNRQPTPDVSSFRKVIKKAKIEEGVVFDIIREGKPLFLSYMAIK
jgi:serine protease Do